MYSRETSRFNETRNNFLIL